MRQITMCTEKDGKLSGEILEDGKYWQIPPFEYSGKHKEAALLERLDIVQIESQLEADIARGGV
ncbi:hypothetical protein ACTXMK_05280 [Psychrobacter celer]|uniref:hypothetical protein n=1 Tax=Psychrobacter celer TaxID=306572 RepID=UPI003FD23B59